MKSRYLFFFLFISLFLFAGCESKGRDVSGKEAKSMKIGYMICNSLPETTARFEPLTSYLTEKTGQKFESVYVNTFDFEDLVRDKEIDFAHTNSILPIIFKKEYGLELMAVEIRGKYGYRDTGTIIALKESGIDSFDDMRGKTMIFGPALAPFGYMAQYSLMLSNGFDPEEDLTYYAIPWGSFKHEKVIYGVLFGAYDIGAAPYLDLDHMAQEGKIKIDDFNIIAESVPMPYCTVGVMPHVDRDLAGKVKKTLLDLRKDETVLVNGEVLRVLESAWIEGFAEARDSEYDCIRERLKQCNMAPYRKF